MKHIGTINLETERLILRPFCLNDAEDMFDNWASDDEVTRYLSWPTHKSVDDSISFINFCLKRYHELSFYNWAIELKDTHEVIGNIAFVNVFEELNSVELGWVIGRPHWGRGYAPEAANKILDVLFDQVDVNCIFAKHDINNPKSGKAMQKLGMTYEGVFRQCHRNNQGIVDCARYSILKSER